jgi:hypothetical protein
MRRLLSSVAAACARRWFREILDDLAPRLAIIMAILMLTFIAYDVWWEINAP